MYSPGPAHDHIAARRRAFLRQPAVFIKCKQCHPATRLRSPLNPRHQAKGCQIYYFRPGQLALAAPRAI